MSTPRTDSVAKRYETNEIGAAEVLIHAAELERENIALRRALTRWQKLADMGLKDFVPKWLRGVVVNTAAQGDNALELRKEVQP